MNKIIDTLLSGKEIPISHETISQLALLERIDNWLWQIVLIIFIVIVGKTLPQLLSKKRQQKPSN